MNRIKTKLPGLLILLLPAICIFARDRNDKQIWFNKPAKLWDNEGLPIGNGRMGAMMIGGIKTDSIQFNEISLWSGDNNWDGGYDTGDHGFGSYRNFGEFVIEFDYSERVTNYKRALNIITGIHTTSFISKDN